MNKKMKKKMKKIMNKKNPIFQINQNTVVIGKAWFLQAFHKMLIDTLDKDKV
jgi:hypothetical protein